MFSFVESSIQHEESLVADELYGESSWMDLKLEFILYGSLSRPPEAHYEAGFWKYHNGLMQLRRILHISSGLDYFTCFYIWNQALECTYVAGDVVVWCTLASRYVHGEGELRLDFRKQILEYVIDKRWLEMLLVRSGFMCHLCKLTRLRFLLCLSRVCASEVGMVNLPTFSRVAAAMHLLNLGGLRVIASHIDGLPVGFNVNTIVATVMQAAIQELYSLLRQLENFQDLLCVDLVGCWSLRGEFQVDSWQFKMMRITLDQCYYLLLYFCQATMSRLHPPHALHLDVLAHILLMHKVVIQPHTSPVISSQGELSYTNSYAELRSTLLRFVSLPRQPYILTVKKLLKFKKITSRLVFVGCGRTTVCETLQFVKTIRRMILSFTYGSSPRPPDGHVSVLLKSKMEYFHHYKKQGE